MCMDGGVHQGGTGPSVVSDYEISRVNIVDIRPRDRTVYMVLHRE